MSKNIDEFTNIKKQNIIFKIFESNSSIILLISGILSLISSITWYLWLFGFILAMISITKGESFRYKSEISLIGWFLSVLALVLFVIQEILIVVFQIPAFWIYFS